MRRSTVPQWARQRSIVNLLLRSRIVAMKELILSYNLHCWLSAGKKFKGEDNRPLFFQNNMLLFFLLFFSKILRDMLLGGQKLFLGAESQTDIYFDIHTLFYKSFLYNKPVLNVLPNYNRNTIGYCYHNNREQKKLRNFQDRGSTFGFLWKKMCAWLTVSPLQIAFQRLEGQVEGKIVFWQWSGS